MLDAKLVSENPGAVKADLRKRGDKDKIGWVDDLVEKHKQYGRLTFEAQKLRHRRNEVSRDIPRLKKEGKDVSKLLAEMKKVSSEIPKKEKEIEKLKEKTSFYLMRLPNIMHESVPKGASDEDNLVVRKWGKFRKFPPKPLDHIEIGEKLGLIDTEKASEVAGARFFYLKGDLVRLNQALISFAMDFMHKRRYELFEPPYMLRKKAIGGAVDLSDFEDVIYKVEGEDLHLIGTSEHALLAYHLGEILDGKKLPLRYSAISTCFRKEAGSHGRDTKGIFRVHQFDKVEQFMFSRPEDSWKLHEELIGNVEEFFKALDMPFRVVNVCTGDLGTVAAKKYDLEAWLPGQGKYREVASCSNCTDYQSRRSGIRFRDSTADQTSLPHTLNSTLVATGRTLIAIMENYQNPDGTFGVPKALQPYMGGQKTIGKQRSPAETDRIPAPARL